MFADVLGEPEFTVAVHAGDINAMRPLDWAAFGEALRRQHAARAVERVAARVDVSWRDQHGMLVEIPQGFGRALVRVRRGQQQFRGPAAAGVGLAITATRPDGAPSPRLFTAVTRT